MSHSADPRRSNHAKADVALTPNCRFSGVETHADRQPLPVRPLVGIKCTLNRDSRLHGIPRPREGEEEGVALCVNFAPAAGTCLCSQDLTVISEDFGVPLAEGPEQASRAFDVREEERHRSGRQAAHGPHLSIDQPNSTSGSLTRTSHVQRPQPRGEAKPDGPSFDRSAEADMSVRLRCQERMFAQRDPLTRRQPA